METTKVYVGTYAKYNNGSTEGEWLDLSDFLDKDEFLERCAEIHSDEEDPEFMFQDIENDHFNMVSESDVDEEIFQLLQMDEDDLEILAAYRKALSDSRLSLEEAQDAYAGKYDSDANFAESMADELGYLDGKTSWPFNCIDWDSAAVQLMYDYIEQDGFYFRNC